MNALTEWSKKQVKKTFNSDFEEGFPIIYSIKEKGEINIQNAYGELKNGKKVIFDVDGLTWEEGEIEMKDGGKLIGKQKNLDVNKNGKLDAQDFKMLRGKMAKGGEIVVKSPRFPYTEGYFKTTKEANEFILRQSKYRNVNGWNIEKVKKSSNKHKMAMGGEVKVGNKFGDWSITQYKPIVYEEIGGTRDGLVKLVNQNTFDEIFI